MILRGREEHPLGPLKTCDLRGHLQRCQMPDIEKQPKTAPSGSRWSSRKTAGKTAETPEKQLFWLFFRLFFGCFGCFPAVLPWPTRHPFRLFSMSGIWHLCRWPRRSQLKTAAHRPRFPEAAGPQVVKVGAFVWHGKVGTFGEFGLKWPKIPKGPFRTKNTTTLKSVVFCYGRSVLLSVPFSCHFSLEKQALLSTIRSVLLLP